MNGQGIARHSASQFLSSTPPLSHGRHEVLFLKVYGTLKNWIHFTRTPLWVFFVSVQQFGGEMERPNRGQRWANLKQRLGLMKGMGCCGGSWSSTSSTLTMIDGIGLSRHGSSRSHRDDGTRSSAASGMNLAMALAAERNLTEEGGPTVGNVKSLMRLFEEIDGGDWKTRRKESENNGDWLCCVCMERSKGAAFIPCGHTFCRVCSRELWLNGGTCPICSRSIIEILDIF
ncbi:hypothetical protein SDJN03_17839, partial [Cucurbita argyrosperma subsp. sororia]